VAVASAGPPLLKGMEQGMECFQQVVLKAATSHFVDASGKFLTVPVNVRTVPGSVRTVPDGSERFLV